MKAREHLETILRYGPTSQIQTPLGIRLVRRSLANRQFWLFYHDHHEELKAQGITLRQSDKQWWVTEWTVPGCAVLDTQKSLPEEVRSLLFKWQIPPSAQLVEILGRRQFAADFSDAGTGKTAVACAVAKAMGRPLAVMCAKYARSEWAWMARRFGCQTMGINHWEIVRMDKTEFGRFETIPLQLKSKVKDQLVFNWNPELRKARAVLAIDEIHNCGGMGTRNSLMAIHTRRSGITTLGITATAADNPVRMQALAYLLGLIKDPGLFFAWAHRHGVKRGKYGFTFGDPDDPHVQAIRADALKRIHLDIFGQGLAVRVRKVDIPNFPKNQIVVQGINCDGAEKRIDREYRTIGEAIERLNARRITQKEAKNIVTIARQKIELLKIPAQVEMIKDDLDQGFQDIIFVNYRDTAIALGKALGVPILIGGQPEHERVAVMRGFQGTKLIPPTARVAPSTYGAGSESINLQDEFGWGPRNVILSPTFRSQHVIQAANRAWRATSVSPSIQRFVFAWNTIEEQTMSNLRDRISQLEILNDGETIPMPDHRMDD